MSRSIKKGGATRPHRWGRAVEDPTNEKAGVYRRARRGPCTTERIIRRNRRMWARLGAKIDRRVGREEIAGQLHGS
jgi:hypothetical protein